MNNYVIDITGYVNDTHNSIWNKGRSNDANEPSEEHVFVPSCVECSNKDKNDAILETFLRFQITHKLYVEADQFDILFAKYPGIRFNLNNQELLINRRGEVLLNERNEKQNASVIKDESDLVHYFLAQRATLGVGFCWKKFDYSTKDISIPILKGGKMWQLMMRKVLVTRDKTPVYEEEWKSYKPDPIPCLFCTDHPRDLYPGNFIVNQNILFLRSFVWVDKRKLHMNRYTNNLIMYNENSQIIELPFLKKFCQRNLRLNVLGNMAFFTTGKIFTSFIEMIISRLEKLETLNNIIEKLKCINSKKRKKRQEQPQSFQSAGITVLDLVGMYKECKKPKNFDLIITTTKKRVQSKERNGNNNNNDNRKETHSSNTDFVVNVISKKNKIKNNKSIKKKNQHHRGNNYENNKMTMSATSKIIKKASISAEDSVIRMLRNPKLLNDVDMTRHIIDWFQFPVSSYNLQKEVYNIIQALKRGEIDKAISQTSNLNKDYESNTDEIHSLIGAVSNADVHRIGRFNRNAPAVSFSNIFNVACSLQKVLTKDSKTKEPRYITNSERGFIDLTNTADTPKNCGLIVESVLDTIISTSRFTAVSPPRKMHDILSKLFPNCKKVYNNPPKKMKINKNLSLDTRFTYILANQVLYKIPVNTIPNNLLSDGQRLEYVMRQFGEQNYFRMTQYALKILVPFIELLQHEGSLLWECTSYDRNIYKLHTDGLFYSPTEFLTLYHEPPDSHSPPPPLKKNPRKNPQSSSSFFFNFNNSDNHHYNNNDNNNLWVGKDGKYIPNIFGPSIRLTPHANKCHLPRVGHATYSAKNFVGVQTNSLSVGELHQKTVTSAFYNAKSYPSEIINLPGCYPKILVASGFNNQEDGIVVRKGAIDIGMFSATHYETATIKIQGNVDFKPTTKPGEVLRKGVQIGVFYSSVDNNNHHHLDINDGTEKEVERIYQNNKNNNNNNNKNNNNNDPGIINHEIYSQELKLVETTSEGGTTGDKKKDNYISVIWIGKSNMMDIDDPTNDFFYRKVKNLHKLKRSLAFQSQNPNYQQYRCVRILYNKLEDGSNVSRLNVFYASLLTPSIGDKLQTTTANKGVITDIVDDQDMPYVINDVDGKKTLLMPDLIINPQFMKRQTLDNVLGTGEKLLGGKNSFMNRCFSFRMTDTMRYIILGDLYASGTLMNPRTGLPYLTRVEKEEEEEQQQKHYYDYPRHEYYNIDDGFVYTTRESNSSNDKSNFTPHELTTATIYTTRYFLVHNHRASSMMQASHPNDVTVADFTGTPVKGKRGGFATGPQEQMTLVGLGAERLNMEISQFRSEFGVMNISDNDKNYKNSNNDDMINDIHTLSFKEENDDDMVVVVPASKTLKRTLDEIRQYGIKPGLKIQKCNTMKYKKN